MDTGYLKRVLFYLLSAVCAAVLVFYLCYHLFNGFSAEIVTEPALAVSETESFSAQGYIFRNERVISAAGGTVDYAVDDGERVGVGALLAQVYAASDDGEISRRIKDIDREIALLEESNIGAGVVMSGTDAVDRRIDEILADIRAQLAAGRPDYADREADSLLIQLNRRSVLTGSVQNYDGRIAQLRNERSALTARLSGDAVRIYSGEAGYFFCGTDGYEHLFTPDRLSDMTLDEFAALCAEPPVPQAGGIGKMVATYTWHLAVPVSRTALDGMTAGKTYSVCFPHNFELTLPMTLERILTEIGRDDAVLVFACDVMPEDFSYLRCQSVEIVTGTKQGLRVPDDAVRVIDGVTGVYVIHGGTVQFRRIEILFERDGECIVAAELETEEGEVPALALHDEIITAGKDLYDGKILA